MIGITVAAERLEHHAAVRLDLCDDRTGATVTIVLRRRGAACLTACLAAAVGDDDAEWETDFRVHGEITR